MRSILTAFLLVTVFYGNVLSQDSLYTHSILQKLTSEKYNGRGYVKNGDRDAARFLKKEFKRIGLKARSDYFQKFSFPVNTFPGEMEVRFNEHRLTPGVDFIVDPSSPGLKGVFQVLRITRITAESIEEIPAATALLLDTGGTSEKELIALLINAQKKIPALIVIREKKLTWSVSSDVLPFAKIEVLRNAVPAKAFTLSANIKEKFVANHRTQNIIGYLPGTSQRDSFIIVTAHYDHLGRMGSATYFPGANDNASGVSMLLNMAHYFSLPEHRPVCSMLFLLFAGEEAGLLGSHYFTEHPTIDLQHIRFLLNLDLLGTGDDGIMVVNGEILPDAFAALDSINTTHHFVPSVGKRGKAHNSDHYYFTEKNVPAFFVYTLGGVPFYHDIYDREQTLPLTKYKEVFQLLTKFLETR